MKYEEGKGKALPESFESASEIASWGSFGAPAMTTGEKRNRISDETQIYLC